MAFFLNENLIDESTFSSNTEKYKEIENCPQTTLPGNEQH